MQMGHWISVRRNGSNSDPLRQPDREPGPGLDRAGQQRIGRRFLSAVLKAGVTMLQFALQGEGVQVSSQLLTMLPYLATIAVLVLISRNATWIRINMPASLGKPFFPGA